MRLIIQLGFVFALCLFVAALALAHPHGSGKGYRDSDLSWAIIDDDHNHSHASTQDALEEIEDLKSRFGDEFLFIRDREDRYVIKDRALIQRAEEASHRIGDHAHEIKTLAKAQARVALSQAHGAKARVKLERIEAQLEEKIESREDRGDEADELKAALDRVREDLEELEDREPRPLTRSEELALEKRRQEAQEELQKAVREMREEIRDILKEAKQKGLAEQIR